MFPKPDGVKRRRGGRILPAQRFTLPHFARDYPPDDGSHRSHWRWNYACLGCRSHARRTWAEGRPSCPRCREPMGRMPMRMSMPSRKDKGWERAVVGEDGWIRWPRD